MLPSTKPIDGPDHDKLGLAARARDMARFLASAGSRLTVCVSGEWGGGKTSFMNMVASHLEDLRKDGDAATRLAVVRPFEAWRHEQQEDILAPLYRGVRSDALSNVRKAWDWGEKIAIVSALSLGGLVKDVVGAVTEQKIDGLDLAKIKEVGEVVEEERLLSPNAMEKLKSAFEGLSKKQRVIVMVDDLDRCFPDAALQIVEALKLVLDIENFVYLLGLQYDNIEGAMVSRFKRLQFPEPHDVLAQNYLNKIVDVEYKLPPMTLERACNFLYGFELDWLTPVDMAQMLLLLDHNPRVLVRAVNSLGMVREFCGASLFADSRGGVTKCMLLDQNYPNMFAWLCTLSKEELRRLEGLISRGQDWGLPTSAPRSRVCDWVRRFRRDAYDERDRVLRDLGRADPPCPRVDDDSISARHPVMLGPPIGGLLDSYAAAVGSDANGA